MAILNDKHSRNFWQMLRFRTVAGREFLQFVQELVITCTNINLHTFAY